jgi:hypothetical protein
VCAVAAQPGHTKDLQSVQLERGIRIVDSPGVVFDDDIDEKGTSAKGSVLLRNVVRVEDVEDPIAVGKSPDGSQNDVLSLISFCPCPYSGRDLGTHGS